MLDNIIRAALLAHLRGDAALGQLVPRIEDGQPQELRVPALVVGEQQSADWGTKDRAGRELVFTLGLALRRQGSAEIGATLAALEAVLERFAYPNAIGRVVRSRMSGGNAVMKGSGWQAELQFRVRALA